jgi:hypothetical protein
MGGLVCFTKRGFAQANRITLAKLCRCNNSPGEDFAHHLGLSAPISQPLLSI